MTRPKVQTLVVVHRSLTMNQLFVRPWSAVGRMLFNEIVQRVPSLWSKF